MSGKTKEKGIKLLAEQNVGKTNRFGKPVVGWRSTSQGVGGLYNPLGFGLLRGVVWMRDDSGEQSPLYDQPVIVENAGAIVIAQSGDRIGLIQNYRMVGERILPDAASQYVQRLNDEYRWDELMDSLGKWMWEAPRGLLPGDSASDLETFILKTAKMEALDEGGLTLDDVRIVGRVNVNSTFFPHAQWVVSGRITATGQSNPEDTEMIGATKLFTRQELRELNNRGEFDDGLTLAAMALCGLSL